MDLEAVVLERAGADEVLPDVAKLLVLAALEGPAELDAAIGGSGLGPGQDAPSVVPARGAAPGEPEPVQPARAYLSQISVEGFRGIGERATLTLNSGPGLTVVAGATAAASPASPRRSRS